MPFRATTSVFFSQILRDRPAWIGFSTTTSSFPDAIRLANHCRDILPEASIVFGGVHVSALREQLMRDYPVIDYCVVGEGEQTLLELMNREAPVFQKSRA